MVWRSCKVTRSLRGFPSCGYGGEFTGRSLADMGDPPACNCVSCAQPSGRERLYREHQRALRDKFLNLEWFSSLHDARQTLGSIEKLLQPTEARLRLGGSDSSFVPQHLCCIRGALSARSMEIRQAWNRIKLSLRRQ